MTLTKLLLCFKYRLVFIGVDHVSIIYKLLTAERGRVTGNFLPFCMLFRRFIEVFRALVDPVLLKTGVEPLERLISTVIVMCAIISSSMMRSAAILGSICRKLLHLLILVFGEVFTKGCLMIVIVSNLLL